MTATTNGQVLSLKAQKLKHHESVIAGGFNTFVSVGNSFCIIRDEQLYSEKYDTFKEYCEAKWNMSDRHARRMIDSANVYETLAKYQKREIASETSGQNTANSPGNLEGRVDISAHSESQNELPTYPAQTYPLVGLEPEKQAEVWNEAVASSNGKPPTATQVKEAVANMREPGDDTEQIKEQQKRARENGQVLFDWKAFDKHYAELARDVDRYGKAHHCKDTEEANGLRKRIYDWQIDFKAWTKKGRR